MTREELLAKVNGKVDTTKFKSLSSKTINEELDDVLEDYGENDVIDDKVITKLANRLKRMDGNVHKSVSDEMKKNKEAEDERKRQEEEERKRREAELNKSKEADSKYDALLSEIKALKEANEARDKKAAKSAAIDSIKRGLKDKFDKANLEMNDFFLDTALSKLEIPDSDIDVVDLVSKAEGIYTADYKRANGGNAIPRKTHSTSNIEEHKIDEHEWDDIKDVFKNGSPKGAVK